MFPSCILMWFVLPYKCYVIFFTTVFFSSVWIFWCALRVEQSVKQTSHSLHMLSFLSMNSVMCSKIWTLGEGLVTVFAFVRFLSSVNFLMYFKIWVASEIFSTFLTKVSSLFRMNSLMYFQIWIPGKVYVTGFASVSFLHRMIFQMCLKSWALTKWSVT